jgi:hypothetical protein
MLSATHFLKLTKLHISRCASSEFVDTHWVESVAANMGNQVSINFITQGGGFFDRIYLLTLWSSLGVPFGIIYHHIMLIQIILR